MIPQQIHYCWFGPNEKSELNVKCIESWKKLLPDFEIKEWNESNFPIDDYPFAKEAYRKGKYAFVADVARFYALQQEGGVYFDLDVEILKPIHHLLTNTAFMGFEANDCIAVGIIGSIPGGEFVNVVLDCYKERPFSMLVQPRIISPILQDIGFELTGESQRAKDFLTVYSEDYFYPYSVYTRETRFTENTVCLHHYEGSWLEKELRRCYEPK
jgi:mannosyltransferase OCH1-like enzyme